MENIYELQHAPSLCFDCERVISQHDIWEPFVKQCTCGCLETYHVKVCRECISDMSEIDDNSQNLHWIHNDEFMERYMPQEYLAPEDVYV